MTPQRKRWYAVGGGAAGAAAIAATLAIVLWGGPDTYVPPHGASGTNTLLWLYAPRDMGRLPPRADWCAGASHCWVAQETAGATQLADTSGAWTLGVSGTPRTGVYTGLPVEDSTGWVDFTSELSTHTDGQAASGTGSWVLAAQAQPATNLVSVSAIVLPTYRQATARVLYSHRATATTTGYEVGLTTAGLLYMTVENTGGTTKTVNSAAAWDDGAWRCVTWVLDGRASNAGKIYIGTTEVQEASPDLNTGGTWAFASGPATLGADAANANVWPGGIARLKVMAGVAVPADNCGTLWEAVKPSTANKIASASDSAWTQTGGARCFPSSATTALCTPGGKAAPTWDAVLSRGGRGWGIGPNRTARNLWSSHVCNTTGGWTVGALATATCASAVSPAGTMSAAVLSLNTDSTTGAVSRAATGYTNSQPLQVRVWANCSAGTVLIQNSYGPSAGKWTLNCTTVGGVWTLLHSAHAAVTVNTAFAATAAGGGGFKFLSSGGAATISVWMPTQTEAFGDSVIVVRGTAVSTGTIGWTIDNDPAVYYHGDKGKITLTGDWLSGGCVDTWNGSTDVGHFGGDGTHWFTYSGDATPVLKGQANLTQSGLDTLIVRWDSTAAISGGIFEVLTRDGVQATWDTTPIAAWTSATPTPINLDGYGTTSCRASLQELKIEDRP